VSWRLWRIEALVAGVAGAILLVKAVVDAYQGNGFLADFAYGIVAGGAAALCWRNSNTPPK
jgi:hypothetical protein